MKCFDCIHHLDREYMSDTDVKHYCNLLKLEIYDVNKTPKFCRNGRIVKCYLCKYARSNRDDCNRVYYECKKSEEQYSDVWDMEDNCLLGVKCYSCKYLRKDVDCYNQECYICKRNKKQYNTMWEMEIDCVRGVK